MATVYVSVTLGTRRLSGQRTATVNRATTVGADVTIAINTATVTKKSDLIQACRAAADHLLSDTVN
jgi:hypothetical protein